jgi:hypothetical protein
MYPGCEADHSPLSGVEVKKQWNYTSTPHINLHCIDKYKFTFTWLSVFISEPLHAPSLNILLYKGFYNENVQLNYISHTNTPYGKMTLPNSISNQYHADCSTFTDCINNLSCQQ